MNEELSKVVVTLNNKKGIDSLLNTERFEITLITNYEGIQGRPVFEFSIIVVKEGKFAEGLK